MMLTLRSISENSGLAMQLDGKELPERSGTSAKCPNKGNSELKGQKSASDQPKKPQDGFPSGSRKPEVGLPRVTLT